MSVNSKMTAIADAIRSKTKKTGTLTLDQMAADIASIDTSKPEQTKTATPSLSQQTIVPDSGKVLSGVTINPITAALLTSLDPDFKPENIAKDANLFGLVGTHAGGSQVAYGTIVGDNTSTLSISGLPFAPKRVMVTIITTQRWARQVISAYVIKNGNAFHAYTGASGYEANYAACSASFTNTGVTITASDSSVIWNKLSSQYAWIAFDE